MNQTSPMDADRTLSEKLDGVALRLAKFPRTVGAVCVAVALLIGVADYSSGVAASMAVFYLVPVTAAAFIFGQRAGLLMACCAAAVNIVADWLQFDRSPEISHSIAVWNSFSRLTMNAIVATLVAALRGQWHHERLVARIDATTGVANARALYERLEESLAAARRNGSLLSVCSFDLDDFKSVNDLHGHVTGDRLLRDVARAAEGALRPGDTVARSGGDEFVLVLPGAGETDARAAVDRLVETLKVAAARGGIPITLSVGVLTSPPDIVGADELLRKADELMYDAKRAGKNRTVTDSLRAETSPSRASRL